MKLTLIGVACTVALLTGCANNAANQAKLEEARRTVPVCQSEKECEIKWAAARTWILANSGMKLQHVTADFLETYNPPANSPLLAVRVNKEPLADGSGYRLAVTAWCANIFGCQPNQFDAILDFNRTVGAIQPPSF